MHQDHSHTAGEKTSPKARKFSLRKLFRSKDGAAAIEFAILAIPYFIIVFAIIETFVAYTAEQLVANGVDTMGRKLRTGNIIYNAAIPVSASNMDRSAFRTAFCNEVSILIKCSASEIATPNKLWLDVKSYTNFSDMPNTVPVASNGDLDTTSFTYSPGAAGTKNMLRAYYKWDIITDLLRPYISNMRPSSGSYFLIVETAVFKNEDYP